MVTCEICKINTPNKRYCSIRCRDMGKFGRKRPDVVIRNTTNNPLWNEDSRLKMAKSLTGKKHSPETIKKRSESMKKLYADDPERAMKQVKNMHEKYTSKIPLGWNRLRVIALERDNYTCQNCGEDKKRLIVHHRDHMGRNLPSRKLMNNDLDNLVTLCHGCHLSIHAWTVRRGESPKMTIHPL